MGTKISELTSGTAAATDQIPVNQSGTTKRVTALAVGQTALTSADSATDDTTAVRATTGAITGNVAKASGEISAVTGATSSTDSNSGTGNIVLRTGSRTANSSGNPGEGSPSGTVTVSTGATKNEFSGTLTIESGGSEYQSGDVFIKTGAGLVADDGYSGYMYIATGATSGTAEPGDIEIKGGRNLNTPAVNGRVIVASFMRLYVSATDPAEGPIEGDVYYNSTAKVIKVYDGSVWNSIVATPD